MRFKLAIMLLLYLVCCSANASQQIPQFNLSEINNKNISQEIAYFQLPNGEVPTASDQINLWLSGLSAHQTTNLTGDRYIAVFSLHNDTDTNNWFVYPYGSVVESIATHSFNSHQTDVKYTGYKYQNEIYFHYGSNIQLSPGETHTIVMLFESKFFFAPIKISLSTLEQAKTSLEFENIILLLSFGVVLALGIYNLFLFIGTRQLMYLYYACSTLVIMWGWLHIFGVIEVFTQSTHNQWLMVPYLLGAMFMALFCAEFLNLAVRSPKQAKILKIIAVSCLLMAPFAYFSPALGLLLATIGTSASLIFGIICGVISWRAGYSPAKYFVCAYLATVIPNMVGNLINLGFVSADVNIYLLGQLGGAADALLLAFALAEKVRKINDENLDLTVNLEKKVKKRTSELLTATKEAQQATVAKSDFLAKMSHEIRTPMNAIIGLSRLSLKSSKDKEQQDNLTKILDSSETLLGLINDILDFSKIEAGKMNLERTLFSLDKTLQRAVGVVSFKAHEKNLELITYISPQVPNQLLGDPLRIQQIITNLCSNAVKFTQSGTISVSVTRVPSDAGLKLQFDIKDTGIGMDKVQQEKLFKSFSQVDDSVTRQYGGTGLGLAICRQLTELMSGEIWLLSEPGKGSTFSFTLMLEEHQNQQRKVVNVSKEVLSKQQVLVVDDIALSRKVICEALELCGIHADTASNGLQAIEKVKVANPPYDLVIMDWRMPEMNGIEAARIIRQEIKQLVPKILMVSAYDKDEVMEHAKDIGINHFLEKPINQSHLLDYLISMVTGNIDTPVFEPKRTQVIPDLSDFNLLLVEDNQLNQRVAIGLLEDCKIKVELAVDGQQALNKLATKKYDIVLMDIQMPIMDGLTAARKVRKDLELDIPIIAMTAHAMVGDVDKSLEAGMNEHITKPIDPDVLLSTLKLFLAGTKQKPKKIVIEDKSPLLVKIEKIPQINLAKALNGVKGKTKLYEGLLKDFSQAHFNFFNDVAELLEQKDIQVLHRLMHSLKSSASYIGAEKLALNATKVEQDLKNDKLNPQEITDIASRTQQLAAEITQLSESNEEEIIANDAVDNKTIQQLLEQLVFLTRESNAEAEDATEQLTALCNGSVYQNQVKLISEQVYNFEFEKAEQLIQQLMQQITAQDNNTELSSG